jgi:hypothetical protein
VPSVQTQYNSSDQSFTEPFLFRNVSVDFKSIFKESSKSEIIVYLRIMTDLKDNRFTEHTVYTLTVQDLVLRVYTNIHVLV